MEIWQLPPIFTEIPYNFILPALLLPPLTALETKAPGYTWPSMANGSSARSLH